MRLTLADWPTHTAQAPLPLTNPVRMGAQPAFNTLQATLTLTACSAGPKHVRRVSVQSVFNAREAERPPGAAGWAQGQGPVPIRVLGPYLRIAEKTLLGSPAAGRAG